MLKFEVKLKLIDISSMDAFPASNALLAETNAHRKNTRAAYLVW